MGQLNQNKPKVFCLGLSRTGTTSLARGLGKLGLRVAHFPLSLFADESFRPSLKHGLWSRWQLHRQLKAARCHSVKQLLYENDVFADLPIPNIYKRLDQQFPESKFIATTRDKGSWLSSMEWLFAERPQSWSRGPLIDELHYAMYGCKHFDREALTASWDKHEAALDAYFRERSAHFLRINLDNGELDYSTICPFLGLEMPDFPFPQVNQRVNPEIANET